jgi:carboxymethylenebutenolidase
MMGALPEEPMPLTQETARFGPAGAYQGLLVLPPHPAAARPLPAVLLIQEAWGVDAHIADVARRLAAAGYGVLAPDLYAPAGARKPGLDAATLEAAKAWLDGLPPGAWADPARRQAALAADGEREAQAGATLDRVFGSIAADRAEHLAILQAALAWLRTGQPATAGGKTVSLGFCMGGGLSAQLACLDPGLAGAVLFYGGAPERAQLAAIACPVLGFYGEADARVNAGLPAFEQGMREEGKRLEAHVLAGAGHAFLNDTRPSFHAGAARQAWARLLGFLAQVAG